MPTFTAIMPKRDLPKTLADRLPVGPSVEVEVIVRTLPEPAKTAMERKKAGQRLQKAMSQFSKEARTAGITDADIEVVLNDTDYAHCPFNKGPCLLSLELS